jgi:manganese efflux pump family protein
MNSIQIAIISLALAMNAFITYVTAGYVMKNENANRILRFGMIMLISQAFMTGTGLWLGIRIGVLAANSNYYIAVGILFIMGLKIILDSIRTKPEDRSFDLKEMRVIVMLSIAEGIAPLVVSIAIGLTVESALPSWIIMIIFQFLAVISGLYAGTRYGETSLRFRTGPIGGLIMLAAALKLLIDLIGF